MYKILIFLIGIFFSYHVFSLDTFCAGGQGTVVKGVNGKTYCLSKVRMNWWSANAWCDSAKGVSQLVHPDEDCDCSGFEGCYEGVSCPNLKNDTAITVWTSVSSGQSGAFMIHMGNGEVTADTRDKSHTHYRALCK